MESIGYGEMIYFLCVPHRGLRTGILAAPRFPPRPSRLNVREAVPSLPYNPARMRRIGTVWLLGLVLSGCCCYIPGIGRVWTTQDSRKAAKFSRRVYPGAVLPQGYAFAFAMRAVGTRTVVVAPVGEGSEGPRAFFIALEIEKVLSTGDVQKVVGKVLDAYRFYRGHRSDIPEGAEVGDAVEQRIRVGAREIGVQSAVARTREGVSFHRLVSTLQLAGGRPVIVVVIGRDADTAFLQALLGGG